VASMWWPLSNARSNVNSQRGIRVIGRTRPRGPSPHSFAGCRDARHPLKLPGGIRDGPRDPEGDITTQPQTWGAPEGYPECQRADLPSSTRTRLWRLEWPWNRSRPFRSQRTGPTVRGESSIPRTRHSPGPTQLRGHAPGQTDQEELIHPFRNLSQTRCGLEHRARAIPPNVSGS